MPTLLSSATPLASRLRWRHREPEGNPVNVLFGIPKTYWFVLFLDRERSKLLEQKHAPTGNQLFFYEALKDLSEDGGFGSEPEMGLVTAHNQLSAVRPWASERTALCSVSLLVNWDPNSCPGTKATE